jgi:hypothetical protein
MKKKTILKIAGITAAAVITGGTGLIFAAPIAATIGSFGVLGVASTGTTISTLGGVALSNASLAALGGGALGTSATAFGVAGGTTVIAATTGTAGVASTAAVTKLVYRK